MDNYTEKACTHCGQYLRIPTDVGGVVMACPACGHRFSSGFKMRATESCSVKDDGERDAELPSALTQRFPRYFKP